MCLYRDARTDATELCGSPSALQAMAASTTVSSSTPDHRTDREFPGKGDNPLDRRGRPCEIQNQRAPGCLIGKRLPAFGPHDHGDLERSRRRHEVVRAIGRCRKEEQKPDHGCPGSTRLRRHWTMARPRLQSDFANGLLLSSASVSAFLRSRFSLNPLTFDRMSGARSSSPFMEPSFS